MPGQPSLHLHKALAQELADKCKRQEKLQSQLVEQRIKVAEQERTLEQMQKDLVELVGEASDLDEETPELWRKVPIVQSQRTWMLVMGRPLGLFHAKDQKRGPRGEKRSRSYRILLRRF